VSVSKICQVTHYRSAIEATSDEEIVRAISDLKWMQWEWAIHRHYLRLLKQEAHKRGLIKGGGGASLRT
jgi:hypothetical protein